ncbi:MULTISPECIES: T9SS type A sorting domain-containing protein [unclassified Polaribacter]|nr:T9SS type A sorting domain-containing protein [Polaribacter sp. IC063]TXD60660.1 T9SS type A sorting domain-containing protein [Polaribacter sp. IC066]
MYNVFGKLVYQNKTNSSSVLVDMRSLSTGVYLLKISMNNTSINKKIIKK